MVLKNNFNSILLNIVYDKFSFKYKCYFKKIYIGDIFIKNTICVV